MPNSSESEIQLEIAPENQSYDESLRRNSNAQEGINPDEATLPASLETQGVSGGRETQAYFIRSPANQTEPPLRNPGRTLKTFCEVSYFVSSFGLVCFGSYSISNLSSYDAGIKNTLLIISSFFIASGAIGSIDSSTKLAPKIRRTLRRNLRRMRIRGVHAERKFERLLSFSSNTKTMSVEESEQKKRLFDELSTEEKEIFFSKNIRVVEHPDGSCDMIYDHPFEKLMRGIYPEFSTNSLSFANLDRQQQNEAASEALNSQSSSTRNSLQSINSPQVQEVESNTHPRHSSQNLLRTQFSFRSLNLAQSGQEWNQSNSQPNSQGTSSPRISVEQLSDSNPSRSL